MMLSYRQSEIYTFQWEVLLSVACHSLLHFCLSGGTSAEAHGEEEEEEAKLRQPKKFHNAHQAKHTKSVRTVEPSFLVAPPAPVELSRV
jgi:hypothetical protein